MATSATRKKRVRFTIDANFTSENEKQDFCSRLSSIRDLLTPPGSAKLDNQALLLALFDCAKKVQPGTHNSDVPSFPTHGSFLKDAGACLTIDMK